MHTTAEELLAQLRDLLRSVRMIKQRYADRSPVPLGHLGLLAQIDDGCHARELATRAGLDQSTVSRMVAALVAHGLIERRLDPGDKRASCLAITPAGRAALDEAQAWQSEVLGRALAGWTPDEVAALSAGIGRFTHNLDLINGHHEILEAAR